MTERELFESCIPQIAEMITICRGLPAEEFERWKRDVMGETKDSVKPFIQKIFRVIEKNI